MRETISSGRAEQGQYMRMNSPQSSKMLLSTMSATSEASKHPSQPLNNQMSGYTSHYIDRNSSGGTSSHQTRNDHRIVKNNLQPFYQHQTSHQLSSTHETLIGKIFKFFRTSRPRLIIYNI